MSIEEDRQSGASSTERTVTCVLAYEGIRHSSCKMRSPWPFLHAVVESSKYKHASNWNLDILVTPELRRGMVQWPIAERVSSTYVKRAPKLSSLLFSTITTGSLVGHVEMVEITGGERNESSRMRFWIQRYAVIARWSLLWGENSRQGHTKAASTLYKDRVDHMCPSDNDNVSATCISYWGGFLIQISPLFSTPVNLMSPLAPHARHLLVRFPNPLMEVASGSENLTTRLPAWWKEKILLYSFYLIYKSSIMAL